MLRGIQAENQGRPLGAGTVQIIKAQGFQMIRVSVTEADKPFTPLPDEWALPLVQEILDEGLAPLVIVRSAADVDRQPIGLDFEHSNEPDLSKYEFGKDKFKAWLAQLKPITDAVERRQGRLWIPGVSNLNKRGFDFIKQIAWSELPNFVCCSHHRYPDGTDFQPAKASKERLFRDAGHREQEIAHLKSIVGSRPLGLSELGYESKPNLLTENQQAERLAQERELFERHGYVYGVVYQINSSGAPNGEQFGLRRADGTWKPGAAAWTT